MPRRLPQSFYDRDPVLVARELLGALLIHDSAEGRTTGRIVETLAYLATGDAACHASRGITKRNATMFGVPGLAYVYSIHARYCFNAVTEQKGVPSAVLIRAVEPLEGLPLMAERRGTDKLLCRGPARLCEAFGVDRSLDGTKLYGRGALWLAEGERLEADEIVTSARIGVTSAHDLPLRFTQRDCRFVSR